MKGCPWIKRKGKADTGRNIQTPHTLSISYRNIATVFKMKKFATLLTITATAYGLAFDGPLPTPVKDLVYAALDGFTPKPTFAPRALPDIFRRQKAANSAVCGYLDGDSGKPSPHPCPLSRFLRSRPPTQATNAPPLHFTRLHLSHHTSTLQLFMETRANMFMHRIPRLLHSGRMHLQLGLQVVRLLSRRRRSQMRNHDQMHQLGLRLQLSGQLVVLQRPHGHGVHRLVSSFLRQHVRQDPRRHHEPLGMRCERNERGCLGECDE